MVPQSLAEAIPVAALVSTGLVATVFGPFRPFNTKTFQNFVSDRRSSYVWRYVGAYGRTRKGGGRAHQPTMGADGRPLLTMEAKAAIADAQMTFTTISCSQDTVSRISTNNNESHF